VSMASTIALRATVRIGGHLGLLHRMSIPK
jgi:hypothetical protein